MGEQMIVLPLIPCAILQHTVLQQPCESLLVIETTSHALIVVKETQRGEDRHLVPDLPVGGALIVGTDQGGAWCNELFPYGRAEGVRVGGRGGLEEVECVADVKEPDGLEVRAEKGARRAEHVIPVRPLRIA